MCIKGEKMKKLASLMFIGLSILFSGCYTSTGQAVYNFVDNNKVVIYKVLEKGVVTFMTKQQIEELKLDKAGAVIEYAYSVNKITGKVVE
jgi:hypothetical protein